MSTTQPYFVLQSADGQFVTKDRDTGPYLVAVPGLAYCWRDAASAEAVRSSYQSFLGVPLSVIGRGGNS